MATFRVTFPGDTPHLDFTADRAVSSGNGVRIYRNKTVNDEDGQEKIIEDEIAYFTSGSFVSCFEVPPT